MIPVARNNGGSAGSAGSGGSGGSGGYASQEGAAGQGDMRYQELYELGKNSLRNKKCMVGAARVEDK
jgi:hypothetical protein